MKKPRWNWNLLIRELNSNTVLLIEYQFNKCTIWKSETNSSTTLYFSISQSSRKESRVAMDSRRMYRVTKLAERPGRVRLLPLENNFTIFRGSEGSWLDFSPFPFVAGYSRGDWIRFRRWSTLISIVWPTRWMAFKEQRESSRDGWIAVDRTKISRRWWIRIPLAVASETGPPTMPHCRL